MHVEKKDVSLTLISMVAFVGIAVGGNCLATCSNSPLTP